MSSGGSLRWKMLALMLAGTVVIYVDRNVLGVLAPILKKDLNFTTEQYSYVVSSFQIVYSFAQPVAGYLTDLIGPRIGYAVAAFVWGLAAALHGFSTGWISMAGFRALLGLSEAAAIPTGTKMSTMWFPSKRALDRHRMVQFRLFDRLDDHAALVILLASGYGWQPAFLMTGVLGDRRCRSLWYWLYRDPEAHPSLSPAERAYIDERPRAGAGDEAVAPRCSLKRRSSSASSSPGSSPSPRGRPSPSGSRSTWSACAA